MSSHRRWSWCVAAVLVAAAVGCSSSGTDDGDGPGPGGTNGSETGGAGSGLTRALERLPAEQPLPFSVSYVDAERVNALLAADPERFAFSAYLGTPLLQALATPDHLFGLDRENAEFAVNFGPSSTYGYWRGAFDPEAIGRDLAADDFEEREGVWVRESDGVTLRLAAEEIAWSVEDDGTLPPSEEDGGAGATLADDADYGWLTECLGEDAHRVEITQREPGERVALRGIGLLAPLDDPGASSSRICVVTESPDAAGELADEVRALLAEEPERYADATVDASDDHVWITVPDGPERASGWLLTDDLDMLLLVS
ncbi:hypothetical protein ACTWP5_00165 [Streptomyces sp. 4N509B]|uniref:hypothetical protein n=1 Tax=Streptomyces sp. 4N509B TaxID=3457413 RepID=UPI003FD10314